MQRRLKIAAISVAVIHCAVLLQGGGWYAVPALALRVLASNSMQVAAALLAALACAHTAKRSTGFARHFWMLSSVSFALWMTAQAFWTVNEARAGEGPAFFLTAELFFFAYAPFALILLANDDRDDRIINWQRTFDFLQVAIVILACYLFVFHVPSQHEASGETVRRLVTSVFNTRNFVLFGALVVRAWLTTSALERSLFGIAAGYFAIYSITTAVANMARFNLQTGTFFDILWTMPLLAMVYMAASWQAPAPAESARKRMGVRGLLARHLMPALLPALVLMMAAYIAREEFTAAYVLIMASFLCYSMRLAVTQYRQQEATDRLQATEERFRLLFTHNPQPIWVFDRETLQYLEVNQAAINKYGYSRDEFLKMTLRDLRPPEDVPLLMKAVEHFANGPLLTEWRHRTRSGQVVDVLIMSEPMDFAGRPAGLAIIQDISQRKQLEEQLRQSQKMEAVGTLAGGIAHDFNNLLTVITGYSQIIREKAAHDEQLTREIQQVEVAANRAAGLIRQLLAFSKRQVLQPQVLNLDDVVSGVEKMLRRLIGEHITLVTEKHSENCFIKADPGQVEQVLINLAVNARDAMPEGGRLTFQTRQVTIDDGFARANMNARVGSFVLLSVSDTGSGMDEATKTRIFEPFFTTKKAAGTGLGLATVYGIVQQSDGFIEVDTKPGAGSTFHIYLPLADGKGAKHEVEPDRERCHLPGFETILLVEDDDGLRELAKRVLARNGYNVLEASRGSEAEEICRDFSGPIHLMVTDVVMPGAGGRELALKVASTRPNMAILYMSGYTDQMGLKQGIIEGSAHFLPKPFTPSVLAGKIREVLDARKARAAAR